MDPKELKACLKTARESIRTKDFKEALKQCKAVLAVDKSNYNALVFVGVAAEGLDQTDQALKAYRRATQECPDQLLAWQGLCSMMDKTDQLLSSEEAAEVYSQLIKLNSSDATKQLPFLSKLADLYVKTDQCSQAVDVISKVLSVESDEEKTRQWNKVLISQLSQDSSKQKDHYELYKAALHSVLEDSAKLDPEEAETYTRLMLELTVQRSTSTVEETCEQLKEKFPSACAPTEILLQCCLDKTIGDSCIPVDSAAKIQALTTQLQELSPTSLLAKVGLSVLAVREKRMVQARDLLNDLSDDCVSGLYYLSKSHLSLHSLDKCVNICEKGVSASVSSTLCVPSDHIVSQFRLLQAQAYREMNTTDSREKALVILEEVKNVPLDQVDLIRANIWLDQGDVVQAEKCMKSLPENKTSTKILLSLIAREKGDHTDSLKLLQEAVQGDPEDAMAQMQLGKLLWELKDSQNIDIQQCFTTLLKAAKLDPYNYESFLYIGHFYRDIQGDVMKSRRCYQKAYDLSGGNDDEAGSALVDTLWALGEENQSIHILETVTAKAAAGCCKWAWLRLGLQQIKKDDPTTAISSLQSALRADPSDNHVWECLADAYFQRGSLTAALKAFTKASELDPDSLYCQYQMASIKQTLGSLSEAVQEYKSVLAKSDNYVPALKGLAESLIQLAKYNVGRCLDGLAQDYAEESLLYLTRAAAHRPDLSCLWKLMGEACTLTHCLVYDSFRVPSKLVGKTASDSSVSTVNKQQLLEIGARCYSQAVKILPDHSALWHDLAVCLYKHSQVLGHDITSVSELLHRATRATRKALSLDPQDWQYWNLLGVISCSKEAENLALAQHCFIKSIGCDNSNVVAWTNLGALYLSQSQIQLAHDAFKSAQSVDPTYIACWVGQALIAELVGHEEAMDLFRHTTELGVHMESAVGYGEWVLKTLGNQERQRSQLFDYCIQQMAALPAASDALIKYTSRVRCDPVAYNMLGLLLEHQKLYRSAVQAFEKAVKLLQDQGDQPRVNDARLNLARALCSLGSYEDSVREYGLCDLSGQVEHMCLYALSLCHSGKLTESFKVMESALQDTRSDAETSQVHTALGMLAYKLNDRDGAKAQLFTSFQTSAPCVQGLVALCALGLLQRDMTLVSAVLDELSSIEDKDKYLRHMAVLYLYKCISQNDRSGGETYMRELVEAHPEQSNLWSLLATYILQTSPEQADAAYECCLTAGSLHTHADSLDQMLLQSRAQLLAGQHNPQDTKMNAVRSAQRAFHNNPGSVSALCTLAGAVHAEAVLRPSLKGNSQLLHTAHGLLSLILHNEVSPEVNTWSLQLSVINRILVNDVATANTHLSILDKFPDPSHFNQFLQNVLSSSLDCDLNSVTESQSLPLVLAVTRLSEEGKYADAVSLITKYLNGKEKEISGAFYKNLIERSASISYRGLQESDDEMLKENFSGIVQTVKNKEMVSPVVHVLQAVTVTEDNKRLSKHHFAVSLDQTGGVGYCSSVARQGLVSLLWDSPKESDQQLIKALLEDGKASKDEALWRLMKELKTRK